mgnify:CR=1 FL=1
MVAKQGISVTILLQKPQSGLNRTALRLAPHQRLPPEAAFNAIVITIKGLTRADWDGLASFLKGVADRANACLRQAAVLPHHVDICQRVLDAILPALRPDQSVTVDFIDNASPGTRYFVEYEPGVEVLSSANGWAMTHGAKAPAPQDGESPKAT